MSLRIVKAREVLKDKSRKEGRNTTLRDAIIGNYFSQVAKELQKLEHLDFSIPHLGCFKIRTVVAHQDLKKLNGMLLDDIKYYMNRSGNHIDIVNVEKRIETRELLKDALKRRKDDT